MKNNVNVNNQTVEEEHILKIKAAKKKREEKKSFFESQLKEWNENWWKKKKEFEKNLFNTVFISRLDYNLTELDISKLFSKYGIIDSIKIVRDQFDKSRGYGFIVFEKEADGKNCINELSRTGLKISGNEKFKDFSLNHFSKSHDKILVDFERSRLIKNWLPRRLGGGLGGRHYTKPEIYKNAFVSAAYYDKRYFMYNSNHFYLKNFSSNFNNSVSNSNHYLNFHKRIHDSRFKKSFKDKYARYISNNNLALKR